MCRVSDERFKTREALTTYEVSTRLCRGELPTSDSGPQSYGRKSEVSVYAFILFMVSNE